MVQKKWMGMLLFLVIFVMITACQDSSGKENLSSDESIDSGETASNSPDEVNSSESEQGGTMLTREWIMDHYDLTEEEVQGYDIDLIIKHGYLLSQEDTLSWAPTKKELLESLGWLHDAAYEKEHAGELKEANDYTYLLEGSASFPSSYNQIKYLGLESIWDNRQPNETDPTGKVSLLIDFEQKKVYYKTFDASVLDDIRKADQVVDLTDDDLANILSQMEEAKLSSWPAFRAEEEAYDNWKYGIETKDGVVFSNMVENLPKNERAWKLFNDLFIKSVPYPNMSK